MPTFVGIDIGAAAVKVAVVRAQYRKVQLRALAKVDIGPADSLEDATRAALSAALGDKGGLDAVAASLDGAKVATRSVNLPLSVQKQLREVIPFELDAQIPFDFSEAVYDFRVLGPGRSPTTPADRMQVLVTVARTDDARSRVDLVKRATGHEPERIDVGAFPLANLALATRELADDAVTAIVDLGLRTSELLILKGQEPVFARTLSFGKEGLPGTAPRLARELRVSIASYRALGGTAPVRVFICGGGAFVAGAQGFLAKELEVPVEMLPVPALDTSLIPPEKLGSWPEFAKALGLALGLGGKPMGMNLRRGPLAFERGFAWVRDKIPVLVGLSVVVLVSFLFSAWAQLYAKSKERAILESALGQVTREVLGEETQSARRAIELLQKQTAIADEDPLPHADAFDVMVKLSEAIPPTMVHDIEELDVQKGHVVVHGIVGSIPDAQAIQTTMKNERCFSDAKITRTSQVVGGERQKYQLEFDVKCPEDQKGPLKKAAAASSAAPSPSASGGR